MLHRKECGGVSLQRDVQRIVSALDGSLDQVDMRLHVKRIGNPFFALHRRPLRGVVHIAGEGDAGLAKAHGIGIGHIVRQHIQSALK